MSKSFFHKTHHGYWGGETSCSGRIAPAHSALTDWWWLQAAPLQKSSQNGQSVGFFQGRTELWSALCYCAGSQSMSHPLVERHRKIKREVVRSLTIVHTNKYQEFVKNVNDFYLSCCNKRAEVWLVRCHQYLCNSAQKCCLYVCISHMTFHVLLRGETLKEY